MSEPTKEAIEEARAIIGRVMLSFEFDSVCWAKEIEAIRKKAREDALEGAKFALDDERVDGTVSPEDAAYNAAIDHCIKALDALKDKPDGEA